MIYVSFSNVVRKSVLSEKSMVNSVNSLLGTVKMKKN